ncbi:hypothetical protein IAT38_005987 [Cryptococcus sp. DSM 104549]
MPHSSAASMASTAPRTLSRHSSLRTRPTRTSSPARSSIRGRTTQGTPAPLSASTSTATSPSRLPATDSVSYFPPFEVMGSECDPSASSPTGEGSSTGCSSREQRAREAEAGQEGRGRVREKGQGHAKGRSLGSIAGFVSASITWGLASIACGSPSPSPQPGAGVEGEEEMRGVGAGEMVRSPSLSASASCEAVEQLARRFTPTPGKRRVLEPLSLGEGVFAYPEYPTAGAGAGSVACKRRMKSEWEVERIMCGGSFSASASMSAPGGAGTGRVDDEEVVEGLVDDTPLRNLHLRQRRSLRRPKPTLLLSPSRPQVQPQAQASLPAWRFPLPSPPVTSLSPDIPLEAFSTAVENPCSPSLLLPGYSFPRPGSTAGAKREAEREAERDTAARELEEVEYDLSPSASPTVASGSQPSTPPREMNPRYRVDVKIHAADKWAEADAEAEGEGLGEKAVERERELKRKSSGMSCTSEATVRASNEWGDGEVTPKGKLGMRGVRRGLA